MKLLGPMLLLLLAVGVAPTAGITLNGAPLDWNPSLTTEISSPHWETDLHTDMVVLPNGEMSIKDPWLRDPGRDSTTPRDAAPTPEPGSLWLLGSGIGGLSVFLRLRRRR